jgi:apolipoprotein N-acyltransferase
MLCLTLAELGRAYLLTGFPWAGISQVWVGWGGALSLAWIGPHGLTALTLLLAGLPLLVGGRRARQALALLPLLVFWGLGEVALRALPAAASDGPVVRLVQPNAAQHEKWDPVRATFFLDRQLAFTAAAPRPDLVVWPETSLQMLLNHAGSALERVAEAADGAPVVVGAQREAGGRYYNSLALLGGAGALEAIHDKHHLVPFGEYIPLRGLADLLGLGALADQQGSGFAPGPGPRLLDFGALGHGLPLICYEAVFPQHARVPGARPDFLIQITNDAWFGQYSGPFQHLAQARMRAIEQGLPMIRVANTGVSAMIDGHGRILAALPLGEAGLVDAPLPPPLAATLYARTGDLPALAVMLLALAAVLLWRRV